MVHSLRHEADLRRANYQITKRSSSLSHLLLLWFFSATVLVAVADDRTSQLRGPVASLPFVRSLEEEVSAAAAACALECCQELKDEVCVVEEDNGIISAIPVWVQFVLIALLIAMSALFSGLTLGLMSLDKTGLEIVMSGDDPRLAAFAKTIYPVRADGNLLLCTLLLGNVAVNSMLSILLSSYAGGLAGFLVSTFLIVIFGEIVPQALCSRYALRIGSITIPVVKFIRCLLFPIAKPLAMCLDCALGRELATTYSNAEMLKLLQIHVQENVLDSETAGAMTGALTYKNMSVKSAMTPIERTFMLSVDDKLTFETIAKIFKTGYSRIPIFEVSKDNIIGLLFVKDLIFIDPEDSVPVRSFIQIFGRGVHVVWPDDMLGDVLGELKKGRSHLAVVRDVNNQDESQDPFYQVKGIITLEDIIEKILGDSIVDETDAFMDAAQSIKMEREETFEWARLRLLDAKIVDNMLSASEASAVAAHLRTNYADIVKLLTESQLARFVSTTPVTTLQTAAHELGDDLPKDLLYEKGVPSDTCCLLLSGKVTVLVGTENFRSEMSAWSILGKSALENPAFVPDFTAFVSDGPCRCLHFTRSSFAEVVDSSTIERRVVDGNFDSAISNSEKTTGSSRSSAIDPEEGKVSSNRRQKVIATLIKKASVSNIMIESPESETTSSLPETTTVDSVDKVDASQDAEKDEKKSPDSISNGDVPPTHSNDS